MKRNWIAAGLTAVLLLTLLTQASGLPAVQITEAEAAGESITLQWTDTGASWYEVYRAASRGGSYTLLARTAAPTYKDGGLQRGNVYFYKVRGCTVRGGRTSYTPFSAVVGRCCVELRQAMATENPCYRQGGRIAVRGLMLHSVGCAQEQGAAFAAYWNQPSAEELVHGVIEPGGTVYQLADWEARCWHCGGSGNDFLIGVEMTEPDELCYRSGTEFTYSGDARETAMDNYNTAVALFANLCWEFALDPLHDIYSHGEGGQLGIASGHGDPEHLWRGLQLGVSMDTFRRDVARMMQGSYQKRTPPAPASYTVAAELLNVRSGPGTEYDVVGGLSEGAAVAVSGMRETQGRGWGRIGDGWICMDYVK